jgi:hypothetical protein
MAQMIKAATRLIEIETGKEWKVERRTRGKDGVGPDASKPLQTWIFILVNTKGHKQFVPEERLWVLFQPVTEAVPAETPQAASPVEANS